MYRAPYGTSLAIAESAPHAGYPWGIGAGKPACRL